VFAYIDVRDFEESLRIRESLLLAIYERLEAAGIGLAFPAQTIVVSREQQADGRADGDDAPEKTPS